MNKKHIWYVQAIVTTPAVIKVLAENEQEAFARLMDGAWHGVDPEPKTWDKASVTHVGAFREGPEAS